MQANAPIRSRPTRPVGARRGQTWAGRQINDKAHSQSHPGPDPPGLPRPPHLLLSVTPPRYDALVAMPVVDVISDHPVRLASTIVAYDSAASTYARRFVDADLSAHHARFASALGSQRAPVLDAGCGAGRDCEALADLGIRTVGLDLSRGLLRASSAVTGAPVMRGDVRRLPVPDGSIGGVWCSAVLLHLPLHQVRQALCEFSRVLQPGGPLFVSVQTAGRSGWRADAGGARWFEQYTPGQLRWLVDSAGFTIRELGVEDDETRPTVRWVTVHARRG